MSYKLKIPHSEKLYPVDFVRVEPNFITVLFHGDDSDITAITGAHGGNKYPYLEIVAEKGDALVKSELSKTPPCKFKSVGAPRSKTYQIDFESPQRVVTSISQLITTINDITFGVQKDKMQSANKNSDAVRGLL